MAEQEKTAWTKGGPSPNARGRGARKLAAASGSDGIYAPSGYFYGNNGEKSRSLQGQQRWVTYDNLLMLLPGVAAAVRAWLLWSSSVRWRAAENPNGGVHATACAELVQQGLLDARMASPWRTGVVPSQLHGAANKGFALHAKGTRRDRKGRIVYSDLGHRPQHTIEKWLKADETKSWTGVEQRGPSGKLYPLDRDELFYSASRDLTDSPEGVGLFRHIVDSERFRTRFRQLLAVAFDTDVNGILVGRGPLAKLARIATTPLADGGGGIDPEDTAAVQAFVDRYTSSMNDLLENHIVTPNRSLFLDSQTHVAQKADKSEVPTLVYEWSIETIKSTIGSLPELRQEIRELDREALRLWFAEWLMMGGDTGTQAMHTDKTSMMGFAIDGWLDRITVDADRDLVWPLVAKNGYDPEECAPTLHREAVMQDALKAAQMLKALHDAALSDDDEAPDVIRGWSELPPRPKVKPGTTPAPKGKPKPTNEDLPDPGKEE